jgi:dGTPase
MFSKIYRSKDLEPDRKKATYVIKNLYEYFIAYPSKLPLEFLNREQQWGIQTIVVDYIAGLTDLYAIKLYKELFVPSTWNGFV